MLSFLIIIVPLVLLYTGQNFFNKLYSHSRDGKGALQFSVLYGVMAGVITFALNGFVFKPSLITLLMGFLNAFMLLMYNVSLQKSSTLGPYAFLMVFSLSGGMIVPLFYDVLFLHTALKPYQIIATVLIIGACIVMNAGGGGEKKSFKFLIWCVVLGLVNGLYSIVMNLQQYLMNYTQRNEMIITTFMSVGVATSAVQLVCNGKNFIEGFKMSRRSLLYLIGSGLCATFAVNLMLYAMSRMPLTVLNVSDNGGVLILSTLSAVFILKEKLSVKSICALAAACVGMVMLSI